MIYLYFIEPKRVVTPVSKEAVIGREGVNVVVRSDLGSHVIGPDLTVSRVHARIFQEGENYYIVDLASLNGTRINGEYVKGWKPRRTSYPQRLDAGNAVEVGIQTIFRVELVERESTEESKRKNLCISLLLLKTYVSDSLITLYKVVERKVDISKLIPYLELITSKTIFTDVMDRLSSNSTSIIKQHINNIKRDQHYYLADPVLLKSLRSLLENLKAGIESEYVMCTLEES